MSSNRESYNIRVLGKELYNKVASSKVLLVGAGGIGCELLKNLVMSGFKDIVAIDLDTIDISNLNRQFLFQRQHVKKAKAHVAKESAHKFNPAAKIESLQSNIKESQFSVQWFKQFTMVLNALDNLDARRHVNAMCLAADVPLVESGTQGYLGQAYVIKKFETECFDCQPKPTPTTYPVCTIRSTPSAPIHCIVWAKSFLFSQLFGNSEDEDAMEEDHSEENAQELAALSRETAELKQIKEAVGSADYAKKVFDKVYSTDINRLLSMESMWAKRAKPTPLDYDNLERESAAAETSVVGLPDQKVWTLKENFEMFKNSVVRLATRYLKEKEAQSDAILSFDKDDDDAMDFVTAASNLRAHVFNIPTKSLFDVKSMAGNIIPAIATTNAVIAGFVIMKAYGILRGDIKNNPRTYLTTGSRLVQEANAEPNPNCGVCRSRSATVKVDFDKTTLRDLIQKVILLSQEEGGAGMVEDEVAIMDGSRMIYDIEFDDSVDLKLREVGLNPGTIIRVTQDDGGEDVDLILEAFDASEEHDDSLKLMNTIPKPKQTKHESEEKKRKMDGDDADLDHLSRQTAKKAKVSHQVIGDVVVLEDDDEDLVLLD
ncbi:ubiquitin-activating enzyme-like protein [Mucor ambiguus]|uniref:Ubiquitin-activating enzyme E1-like n=1 Tax=Mucor ambiguus TaxID=91626 RepID=A0A0C9MFE4_9FUNG|nr:ubiquitin-activating enzyme-like protein [Mucor ambiguus]